MLVGHPVAEGPQVVAQVQVAARLHPGQDPGHGVPWYGTRARPRCWQARPGGPADRLSCSGAMHRNDGGAGRVEIVVAHVSTPVYEGPFDVLLQLVSDHKVDIYDIRLSDLVDAFVAEMARPPALRPADGQRVPGHRGHPGGAQVAQAAARPRRGRGRRGARRLRGARPAARPPARAPGLRGRGRRLRRAHRPGPAAPCPAMAGLEEHFRDLAPDLLAGVTPEKLAAAFMVGSAPAARVRCSTCPTSPWRRSRCPKRSPSSRSALPARAAPSFRRPDRRTAPPGCRSSCASSPCSSCASGAGSPSTRARPSATWWSCGRANSSVLSTVGGGDAVEEYDG